MIRLLIALFFCLILVQERLTEKTKYHNSYFFSQTNNQGDSGMQILNSHQLVTNNGKSGSSGGTIIIKNGRKYNYDGKDFYDAITNKKLNGNEANQLKMEMKKNLDTGFKQMKQAQKEIKQAEYDIAHFDQNLMNMDY